MVFSPKPPLVRKNGIPQKLKPECMRKQGLYGIAPSINLSVLALTKFDFSWLEFIDKLLKNISEI